MKEFSAYFTDTMLSLLQKMITYETMVLSQTENVDISASEARLLWKIGACPKTVSTLADEMGLTLPSVTVAVQKLQKKGYVSKERSKEDGRVVFASLTPKGSRMAQIYRYVQENAARGASAGFTEEEKAAFVSGLNKVNQYLVDRIRKMEAKK